MKAFNVVSKKMASNGLKMANSQPCHFHFRSVFMTMFCKIAVKNELFFLVFQIVAKRAPEARTNGNVGKKKKKLKMSCRQKYKKKGKKPGGIKVSDVAGKKMINHKGQLISKCPFAVIIWTKIPTIFYLRFLPQHLKRC